MKVRPRVWLFAVLLMLIIVGALGVKRHRAAAAQQNPFAARDSESLPQALSRMHASLRPRPDQRCLLAVTELRRWLGVADGADASARFDEAGDHWQIFSGAEQIGDLPEYPGIEDCVALLDAQTARSGYQASAGTTDTRFPFQASSPEYLLQIGSLDDGTAPRSWPPGKLRAVADALSYLYLQGMDSAGVSERLPSLALALDSLATAAGAPAPDARGLLFYAMGYEKSAQKLATGLPEANPIAQFLLRKDDALMAQARGQYGGDLLNYLSLRRFAEKQDFAGWSTWLKRSPIRRMPSWALWQSVLMFDDFSQRSAATAMAGVLTREMRQLANQDSTGDLLAWLGLDSRTGIAALIQSLAARLPLSSGDIDGYEASLSIWSEQFRGSVLNASLVRGYCEGLFYSGLMSGGDYYLDSRGSATEARLWLDFVAGAKAPLAVAYADWYRAMIRTSERAMPLDELLAELGKPAPLGVPPRIALMRYLREYYGGDSGYGSFDNRRSIVALLSGIDSRPSVAAYIGDRLRFDLYELNSSQELYVHAAANGRFVPTAAAYLAQLDLDSASLLRMLQEPGLRPTERQRIVDKLAWVLGEDDPQARAAQEASYLAAPENVDTVLWFVEALNRQQRFADAVRSAERWLALRLPVAGLEGIELRVKLARAYQGLGRDADALRVIGPAVDSGKANALTRAAWIHAALKNEQQADSLWSSALRRYPHSPWLKLEYLEYLWSLGRYQAAAELLAAPEPASSIASRTYEIVTAFQRVFAERPDQSVIDAMEALRGQGISPWLQHRLISPLAASRGALSLKLWQGMQSNSTAQVELATAIYLGRRKLIGEDAAAAMAREELPPVRYPDIYAGGFLRQEAGGLLWSLIPESQAQYPNWLWLMRLQSALLHGVGSPEQMQRLRAYYAPAAEDDVHAMGRYLLGLDSEALLLQRRVSPDHYYELSYNLALKHHCDGQVAAAVDWYQLTTMLAPQNRIEGRLAHDQLYRWQQQDRSVARLDARCGHERADGDERER